MQRESFPIDATVSVHRLRQLRRRYRAEAIDLRRALARAHEDLERWEGVQRSLLADGLSIPAVRKLIAALHDGLAAMERDLVEIRAAVLGLDEDIAADERRTLEQAARTSCLALRSGPADAELPHVFIRDSCGELQRTWARPDMQALHETTQRRTETDDPPSSGT